MASLERRGKKFRLLFRFAGKKYQCPLKTTVEREAKAIQLRVEENIRLLERGRLTLPPEADLVTFLLSDGKLNEPIKPREKLTFEAFFRHYLSAHSQGSLEEKTLQTIRTHIQHLRASLGDSFDIQSLSLQHLQEHVNRRAKDAGIHKRSLSPVTTKKEMATFRAAWNWAVQAGYLTGTFPNRGLRFPKGNEKQQFRTFAEVTALAAREGMSEAERQELWDSVFLTREELQELLNFVEAHPYRPLVPPMFMFAAMTGARRSEIIRLRWHDIDYASETVLLYERKKSKSKRTTRRVVLAPKLAERLRIWHSQSSNSLLVFPDSDTQTDTKNKGDQSASGVSLDSEFRPNDAHILFKRALMKTKWRRLRGWHVFRHSFISNCAAAGVDQRLIDEWVGHTTEEMRRRYRHLIPSQQKIAIQTVFG